MDKEFTVLLEEDEEGGHSVYVPALPGCVSQGDTKEEALAMIREAIKLHVEGLKEDGKPIPEDDVELVITRVRVAA